MWTVAKAHAAAVSPKAAVPTADSAEPSLPKPIKRVTPVCSTNKQRFSYAAPAFTAPFSSTPGSDLGMAGEKAEAEFWRNSRSPSSVPPPSPSPAPVRPPEPVFAETDDKRRLERVAELMSFVLSGLTDEIVSEMRYIVRLLRCDGDEIPRAKPVPCLMRTAKECRFVAQLTMRRSARLFISMDPDLADVLDLGEDWSIRVSDEEKANTALFPMQGTQVEAALQASLEIAMPFAKATGVSTPIERVDEALLAKYSSRESTKAGEQSNRISKVDTWLEGLFGSAIKQSNQNNKVKDMIKRHLIDQAHQINNKSVSQTEVFWPYVAHEICLILLKRGVAERVLNVTDALEKMSSVRRKKLDQRAHGKASEADSCACGGTMYREQLPGRNYHTLTTCIGVICVRGFFREFIAAIEEIKNMEYKFKMLLISELVVMLGSEELSAVSGKSISGFWTVDANSIANTRTLATWLGILVFRPQKPSKAQVFVWLEGEKRLARRAAVPDPVRILDRLETARDKGHLVISLPWIVSYVSELDTAGRFTRTYSQIFRVLKDIYVDASTVVGPETGEPETGTSMAMIGSPRYSIRARVLITRLIRELFNKFGIPIPKPLTNAELVARAKNKEAMLDCHLMKPAPTAEYSESLCPPSGVLSLDENPCAVRRRVLVDCCPEIEEIRRTIISSESANKLIKNAAIKREESRRVTPSFQNSMLPTKEHEVIEKADRADRAGRILIQVNSLRQGAYFVCTSPENAVHVRGWALSSRVV